MNYVESLNLFGVEAKEIPCIKGSGAPNETTIGAVGLLYMNIDNGDMYKCTAVTGSSYVWASMESSNQVSGGNAVLYTEQKLTKEQKAQARENIGAVSNELFIIEEAKVVEEITDILVDASIFTAGKFCSHTSGNVLDNANYYYTEGYIAFPNGAQLFVHYEYGTSNSRYPIVVYYDENYEWIGGEQGNALTQTTHNEKVVAFYNVPENTRYFRISLHKNSITENFEYLHLYILSEKTIGGSVEIPNLVIPKSYFQGKIVVNFGDSIYGNRRPPNDISTELAALTGATVHNCAFGGCRMSAHTGHWDAFSMYRLADAIVSGNWSLQDEAINYEDRTSYAEEPLAILKSLNFNEVDVVTIAYGTNDFTASIDLENTDNVNDTTVFAGALRYSIERLLTAFPNLKVFLCSPTYRFWIDGSNVFTEDSDTKTNSDGVKLTDFVTKTKDIAAEYHLPYIDNYYSLGLNKFNRTQYFEVNDGTHPNAVGCHLIAAHMAKALF